ncbi:MAG: NADH-quinone oxidoreductase subunit A [Mycobacteriales bacterium]
MGGYFGGYVFVALLAGLGLAVLSVGLLVNRLLRPRRAGAAGRTTYECGVDPVGAGWAQSQIRYYLLAFFYVVFAVEAVFVFPWAVIVKGPGFATGALAEMGVFIAFLAVALLYAWRKKVLEWD